MGDISNKINKLLGITDSYQAPDKLMKILYDKDTREKLFMEFLEAFDHNVDYDWFNDYFQEEHADRKDKKQDFTPSSVSRLLAELVQQNNDGTTYDSCSGTGSLTIAQWDYQRRKVSPFDYCPSDYYYHCEELSDRAIPFLLFNLMIRGMNACVVHCDVLSRKAYGAFFVQNDYNDHLKFSSLNLLPYNQSIQKELNVEFVEERYEYIRDTKEVPKHISGFIN